MEMTTDLAMDDAAARELRTRLVDDLVSSGAIRTDAVESALRGVPGFCQLAADQKAVEQGVVALSRRIGTPRRWSTATASPTAPGYGP